MITPSRSISAARRVKTYRLYQAAFDRLPDPAGLGYWVNARDHGATVLHVADSLLNIKQFSDLYGPTLISAIR